MSTAATRIPRTCTDCGVRRVMFAWRWGAGYAAMGITQEIQGYLCFICSSFTAGGRPGAEVLGVRCPKNWHARTNWQAA